MIRRILFATFWFGVFALGLLTIGGGIAGAMESRAAPGGQTLGKPQNFGEGYQVGVAASIEFRDRYGWVVLTVAGLLAAGGSIAGILPGTRR